MDKTDQQLITQTTIAAMRAQQALAILDVIQDHLTPGAGFEAWRTTEGFYVRTGNAVAFRGVSFQDALAQLAQSLVE
jgi:hypothetical protein